LSLAYSENISFEHKTPKFQFHSMHPFLLFNSVEKNNIFVFIFSIHTLVRIHP